MVTTTGTDTPGPSPSAPSERRWLWRSRHDRYLAGVAGGMGERLVVDPFFVRIGFVVATLLLAAADAPPFAAIAYAGAWLAVPEDGRKPVLARWRTDASARRETAVALLLLGATAVLVPRLGPGGSPGLRLGVALFGLAVFLLATGPPRSPAPAAARPGHAPDGPRDDEVTAEVGAWREATDSADGESAPPVNAPLPTAEEANRPSWAPKMPQLRRPRMVRRGPSLVPLAISALVLYAVVSAVVDQILDPGLDPGVAVSGALLVVACVLAASAWRGRGRPVILLGVALVPLWVGFTATGIDRYPGVGAAVHRPTTIEAAEAPFELGYGRTVVDLRDVPLQPRGEFRTTVALTAGIARIRVPAEARLVITGDIGLGSISVNRYSRWDGGDETVVDRTLDRSYGPVPRSCTLQPVHEQGLTFTTDQFASVGALDAELRRRGWPESEPAQPPSPAEPGEWVLVGVDDQWRLCDASAPAMVEDPAVIVLDVHVGIGSLEISREHQA